MKKIQTVNGDISVENLGFTLMHDHLVFDFQDQFRSLEIDYIRGKIAAYQSAGGKTIVDLTPHRRIGWIKDICKGFDLNFILSTGFYLDVDYVCGFMLNKIRQLVPPESRTNTPEQNADRMVQEITEGIEGTNIKAGIIKVASDQAELTPYEINVFTAAAIASAKTKTPIAIHSCTGQLAQWRILEKAGADPSRVFFSHVEEEYGWEGRSMQQQVEHFLWLLKQGCYLQFNNFGFYFNTPKEDLLYLLRTLADKGFLSQIFVSMDCVWEVDDTGRIWHDGERQHPEVYNRDYAYIIKYAIPLMQMEGGFTNDEIITIFEENPRRFFDWE
jgi:phosphotriesterase-related protein